MPAQPSFSKLVKVKGVSKVNGHLLAVQSSMLLVMES
jgi:hypothetical protein